MKLIIDLFIERIIEENIPFKLRHQLSGDAKLFSVEMKLSKFYVDECKRSNIDILDIINNQLVNNAIGYFKSELGKNEDIGAFTFIKDIPISISAIISMDQIFTYTIKIKYDENILNKDILNNLLI